MAGINTTTSQKGALTDSKVGGSKYLDLGIHKNVTIIEALDVELGAGKSPALQLTFEHEDGRIAKHTVFYVSNVFVDGVKTDDTELSWDLRRLTGALISNQDLRDSAFGLCFANTALFERLTGFMLNIEIALPKKGLAVLRSDEDVINVVELADNSIVSGDVSFETFSEGVEWIKEEGRIKERAYTKVVGFSRVPLIEGLDANAHRIQNLIDASGTKATGKGTVSPLGKRSAGGAM